jgi:cell division protein FtsI/penicillin-binding protein 2
MRDVLFLLTMSFWKGLVDFFFHGFYSRVRFFLFFVVIAFAVLFVKVTAVFMTGKKVGKSGMLSALEMEPSIVQTRADIFDRNGVLLARTMVASDLYLVPSKMFDVEEDLRKLVGIFPEIATRLEDVREQVQNAKSSGVMVFVKKGLWPNHREKILAEGVTGVYFDLSLIHI